MHIQFPISFFEMDFPVKSLSPRIVSAIINSHANDIKNFICICFVVSAKDFLNLCINNHIRKRNIFHISFNNSENSSLYIFRHSCDSILVIQVNTNHFCWFRSFLTCLCCPVKYRLLFYILKLIFSISHLF